MTEPSTTGLRFYPPPSAAAAAALLALAGCATQEPGITAMMVGDRCVVVVGDCADLERPGDDVGFDLQWLASPHGGRPGYYTRSTPSTLSADDALALVSF